MEGVWQLVINAQLCGYVAAVFHVNSLLPTIKSRIFARAAYFLLNCSVSVDIRESRLLTKPSMNRPLTSISRAGGNISALEALCVLENMVRRLRQPAQSSRQ